MKCSKWISGVLGVAALGLWVNGVAQSKPDYGKLEYQSNCAACHGENGEGFGYYASFIKKSPSDLTTLAKRNGGVFPISHVYEVIDGRQTTKWHGTRDMPIWGADFVASAAKETGGVYNIPEVMARSRILVLVDYLYRIQKK